MDAESLDVIIPQGNRRDIVRRFYTHFRHEYLHPRSPSSYVTAARMPFAIVLADPSKGRSISADVCIVAAAESVGRVPSLSV